MSIRVIGLDLSLTSTGVAGSDGWVERIRVRDDGTPFNRLRAIRDRVRDYASSATDLVAVEGVAVQSRTGQALTRAGLWHLVMEDVDARGVPWMQVPPTSLKKYATGKGNAGKDEVLAAAVKRFPAVDVRGNDEADALWLAAIGADLLGQPMLELPQTHRAALAKLRLPEGLHAVTDEGRAKADEAWAGTLAALNRDGAVSIYERAGLIATDRCTCYGGNTVYGHEPLCGYEPGPDWRPMVPIESDRLDRRDEARIEAEDAWREGREA